MFLEILPELYDASGKKSYKPHLKKRFSHPTFPFGRYVSQPLAVRCQTLEDVRRFLLSCKAMSDEEAFGSEDYWLPPDRFEAVKKGDCDDFGLWLWRQLMDMGYRSRFVVGTYGRFGDGHCWVTFEKDGKQFIAEPNFRVFNRRLPRLQVLWFHPIYSVEWTRTEIVFYSHKETKLDLPLPQLTLVSLEWLAFWTYTCVKMVLSLPVVLHRRVYSRLIEATSKDAAAKSRQT